MAPPPALMDELLEEVLFRFPPDDPKRVSAAVVCKRRILADPGFRRRYREFHRSPPLLGFLYSRVGGGTSFMASSSSSRVPFADRPNCCAVDARHGRILLCALASMEFIVSNPITGEERRLPMPHRRLVSGGWNAAVLCAAAGCSHLDRPCGGPFTVVCVLTDAFSQLSSAFVYSSEAGAWSEAASIEHPQGRVIRGRSALVGNAFYFILEPSLRIVEYDSGRHELSVINPPPSVENTPWAALITAEGIVGVGFAAVQRRKLYIWSRETGLGGWAQRRVIELQGMHPVSTFSTTPRVAAFVDGAGVIFAWARNIGTLAIDLISGRVTKVATLGGFHGAVPYMSFCLPAL